MNRGNSSNWVHWSYATRTGTSTSIDFLTVGMSMPPPLLFFGSGAYWRSPSASPPSHSAASSPRGASKSAVVRGDCGARNVVPRGSLGARAVPRWRIQPAVTPNPSAVLYGCMETSSMTLPARAGAGPGGAGHVAGGISPAFEELFRTEYVRVVSVAHRVLADQAEAEDVAQDVFVSFYRAHPADASYAPAWLHAAAAHAALNALRGRDRRARREAAQAVPLDAATVDDDPAA